MTNSMEGGVFDDSNFYQSCHIVDMGFNPKALKQLWQAIVNNDYIKPEDKELLFEKYTFQMINRCYDGWMKK